MEVGGQAGGRDPRCHRRLDDGAMMELEALEMRADGGALRARVPRARRAHVAIALAACIVTATALPLGLALSGLGPDPTSRGVVLYDVVIACFVGLGLAVRVLAPVADAWFAMFSGAFAGGMVWALALLLTGPPQGPMSLVALALGGVVGAWAAGVFGSLGFGGGTLLLRLARNRSPRNL
jgi:hypothetical protein